MDYKITKRWKTFTESRSPVTAAEALKAVETARGTGLIVEITNSRGDPVTEAQLKKAAKRG